MSGKREMMSLAGVLQSCVGRALVSAKASGIATLAVVAVLSSISWFAVPHNPDSFSDSFQRSLGLSFTPDVLGLSQEECLSEPVCADLLNGAAKECTSSYPALVADIRWAYLSILDRIPDAAGMEWWCKRVSSGKASIPRMWHGMFTIGERFNEREYILEGLREMCRGSLAETCKDWGWDEKKLFHTAQGLRHGRINVASVAAELMPSSGWWGQSAKVLDEMFCERLCRWPKTINDIWGNALRQYRLRRNTHSLMQIANEFLEGQEGRWCKYRKDLEASVLWLGGSDTVLQHADQCSVPVESHLKADKRFVRSCMPLLNIIEMAVVSCKDTRELKARGVLQTREGGGLAEAEEFVKNASLRILGRKARAEEVSVHTAQMVSWRRSEEAVESRMRGLEEYQWKSFVAHARRAVAEHLAKASGGGRREGEELLAKVMNGQLTLASLAAAPLPLRLVAAFERRFGQLTGQFSVMMDNFVRMHAVSTAAGEDDLAKTVASACTSGVCFPGGGHGRCSGFSQEGEGLVDPNTCCCSSGKKRRDHMLGEDEAAHHSRYAASLGQFRARFGDGLLNAGRFPWRPSQASAIIVLYVHNRPAFFKRTLEALREVRGIDSATLVVSMDGVYDEMMDVAQQALDFCRVRVVVHSRRQPLPFLSPLLAVKEHWMWLQDKVWGGIPEAAAPEGGEGGWDRPVLFIEEDHQVKQDAIETMKALEKLLPTCPGCSGISLRFGCGQEEGGVGDMGRACSFDGFINTAYAFNRSVYDKLKEHQEDFWAFRDGWDWSLFHLMQMRGFPHRQLAPAVSRVRNIGDEGATVTKDSALKYLAYGSLDTSPSKGRISEVEEGPSQYFGRPFTQLDYYHGVTFPKPYDEEVGGTGRGGGGTGRREEGQDGNGSRGGRDVRGGKDE